MKPMAQACQIQGMQAQMQAGILPFKELAGVADTRVMVELAWWNWPGH